MAETSTILLDHSLAGAANFNPVIAMHGASTMLPDQRRWTRGSIEHERAPQFSRRAYFPTANVGHTPLAPEDTYWSNHPRTIGSASSLAVIVASVDCTRLMSIPDNLIGRLVWGEQVVDDGGQEQFYDMLRQSFEVTAVEDGMQHPAEQIIAEALESANSQRVLAWLRDFCTDAAQPSFAASVLRCLRHHASIETVAWRVDLVRAGLTLPSVEIRDAAVQAAETWGDAEFCDVLRAHAETAETQPWLRQYILDVINDLP